MDLINKIKNNIPDKNNSIRKNLVDDAIKVSEKKLKLETPLI